MDIIHFIPEVLSSSEECLKCFIALFYFAICYLLQFFLPTSSNVLILRYVICEHFNLMHSVLE